MDDADRAALNDFNEESLKSFLARNRQVVRRGKCLNCGEVLPSGLYCDADCREDSERRDKILRRFR